ncbi:Phenylacetic acid catabolic protein [Aliiroseovarius sp. YM-037]|uniref:Phenylacetic acid catabolic protein n=1 Tax=Aliiroseovarius sp. YM-037 TaxID=3341728 RepID=UPI003A80748F
MPSDMTLEDYLAQGGVLTSPDNASPRYRAEVMRLMASFVDSELAGAAGFADIINDAPGVTERIAAARIVLEKNDHAGQVLKLMGEFGANTDRYANHHPWTDRLPRDADVGTDRTTSDMRLAVFNYPLDGWVDAVVMNLLMGRAVGVQLGEYTHISYQPLAEAFRRIGPVETRHAELADEGVADLIAKGEQKAVQASVDYWWPRVAQSFGSKGSKRTETLRSLGLRKSDNADLQAQWESETSELLDGHGLRVPA